MTKIIISIILLLTTVDTYSQIEKKQNDKSQKNNTCDAVYRLYATQNIYNFIKLNTRNGQMWQVQFSMTNADRLVTYLSLDSLVSKAKEVNDRFTLYPTQNMYTFILLDQLDGRTWQVQWSIDFDDRFIIPIE